MFLGLKLCHIISMLNVLQQIYMVHWTTPSKTDVVVSEREGKEVPFYDYINVGVCAGAFSDGVGVI